MFCRGQLSPNCIISFAVAVALKDQLVSLMRFVPQETMVILKAKKRQNHKIKISKTSFRGKDVAKKEKSVFELIKIITKVRAADPHNFGIEK